MSRRQNLGRRDLSGWTVTGGSSCAGREVPPLAGGGVDWTRPRCEPDNRLHVRLGRLMSVAGPLLAALPVIWLGLAANQRLMRSGFPTWVAAQDWHAVGHYTLWTVGLAAATGLGGYLSRVLFTGPAGPARVDVTVASAQKTQTTVSYPVGQLVFRRFDSPALLPPSQDVPALPSADQGRWSA